MNINKLNIIISFISTVVVFIYILIATDLSLRYVLPIIIFITPTVMPYDLLPCMPYRRPRTDKQPIVSGINLTVI